MAISALKKLMNGPAIFFSDVYLTDGHVVLKIHAHPCLQQLKGDNGGFSENALQVFFKSKTINKLTEQQIAVCDGVDSDITVEDSRVSISERMIFVNPTVDYPVAFDKKLIDAYTSLTGFDTGTFYGKSRLEMWWNEESTADRTFGLMPLNLLINSVKKFSEVDEFKRLIDAIGAMIRYDTERGDEE